MSMSRKEKAGHTLYVMAQNGTLNEKKLLRLTKKEGADTIDWAFNGVLTGLYVAAALGSVKIVKLLLKHGADKEFKGKHGSTPLCTAVFHITMKAAQQAVVGGGEHLDMPADSEKNKNACADSQTPMAVRRCAVVKVLLDANTNVNACLIDGFTSLITAATADHITLIKIAKQLQTNTRASFTSAADASCSTTVRRSVSASRGKRTSWSARK
jgi:ankyrin repeat protein